MEHASVLDLRNDSVKMLNYMSVPYPVLNIGFIREIILIMSWENECHKRGAAYSGGTHEIL